MRSLSKSKIQKFFTKAGPLIAFGAVAFIFFISGSTNSFWSLLGALGLSTAAAFVTRLLIHLRQQNAAQASAEESKQAPAASPKKSYGSKIDPIIEEGNRALAEMGRLYGSIQDGAVRQKINEIMRITDKIMQDAIQDPADVPQIRKFMNYYLPTTIKLLNAYDRMSLQGIEGENVDKSMHNINEMLDTAIEAYKKRLDSLLANQALDIETDIAVLNTMLERDGLTGGRDFEAESKQSAAGQARGATM